MGVAGARARQGGGDPQTGRYRLEIPGMIELAGRFLRWFIRQIGGSTLLRLVLLSLLMVCVERGLVAVVGHIRPVWLASTAVYGVLAGWLLARSRLPGWGSVLAALGMGLVWLIMSIGQISLPVDIVIRNLPPILKQYLFRLPVESGKIVIAWSVLVQDLGDLTNRLILWFRNAGTSTLIIDPGVTSLVWGLALWLVAAWAAWWIRRREIMGVGLLPATALLVYNVYYTNSMFGIPWLVLAGGGWILLQAMDSYVKARHRWQERRMGQTEIEPSLGVAVVLISGTLMLAGGLLPSVSIEKISNTLQEIFRSQQNKNLAESLGLQQTPIAVPETSSSGIGLSETHAVGPGPQLSQEVMLYVSVDGYEPPPPDEVLIHANITVQKVRYYWRLQTFDNYNGHVWIARTSQAQGIAPNTPYYPGLTDMPENYQMVRQHVERVQSQDAALFVTGDLLSSDQPTIAEWRSSGDLIAARTDANIYAADSRVQSVSVNQLRLAGRNYPDSMKNYLSLPDALPERVRDLAASLTIDQPTPYDQVMAIQDYLRQFPYSLQVPGSPTNRDVADYFLFDLQKGYCDYFATTMAVLVRSVGIPSRLVTGYSSGTYDYETDRFVVVQANSHAWVEVYFPGIGWVEFEPTTNQTPFPRLGDSGSQNTSTAGIPTPVPATGSVAGSIDWSILGQPLKIAELILTTLVILWLLWRLLPWERWWLTLRPADKAITTIHKRLYRQGHAWGVPVEAGRTPHEFAEAFSTRLERFTGNQRLAPVVAAIQADVQWLTGIYTRLLFSPHPPTQAEHLQAVRNWGNIRKGLRRIRYS
jgi:transglutaminase-like putative cysteine protease